ncbi:MAG: hypothetical protein IIZ59_02780 [Clostridia bacterium]|nr:hypothetical protein [Clostridia bacterium]
MELIGGLIVTMFASFIIGIVTRKKKPILSRVLFCISGAIFLLFAGVITYIALPKPKTIETPEGEKTIMSDVKENYLQAVKGSDYDTIDSLLTKYPELVYCLDVNSLDALQFFADNDDLDGVQILLNHGARFDNGVTLKHRISEYAISDYFNYQNTVRTPEGTVKMLKIMIDNGADVNYTNAVYSDNISALFDVMYHAVEDDKIEDGELEAVRVITAAGVDKAKKNRDGKTAAEVYLDWYEGFNDDYATLFFHEIFDPDSMWGGSGDTADSSDY